MKFIVLLFLFLFSSGHFMASAQETNKDAIIKEEVWKVVEDRNRTWVENDFEGHMAIYHSDFRRWTLHSKTLMTKDIFVSFWEDIKKNEEVIKIDIERKEMQILNDGNLAIAHYTINEFYKWIGEDQTDDKGTISQNGQVLKGNLRFSDIYIKADDQWLYLGGHRDGAYLESND